MADCVSFCHIAFCYNCARVLATQVHEGHLSFESPVLGGRLHFLHFATSELPQVVGLLRAQQLTRSVARLGCTGGGAFKYKAVLEESLGLEVVAIDEMESLVRGLEVKCSCIVYQAPQFFHAQFVCCVTATTYM